MRKVLFVWPGLTGYMGDCWRALGGRVELKLAVDVRRSMPGGRYDATEVLRGIDWSEALPRTWRPDAVFTVGWSNPLCVEAAWRNWGAGVRRICCFDMPWRPGLRCLAARFVLQSHVRRFDAAYVTGESAAKYARWLGFPQVETGLFSIDLRRFEDAEAGGGERRGFLFVGRKVREKGIETLRRAFEIYRQEGGRWTLEMPDWIDSKDVPQVMRKQACLVLPSRWEPWGVVVAEAKAAGLKTIVSDRVGARFDVPCDEVVRAGDASALAAAMLRVEKGLTNPAADTGRELGFFDCGAWAERVVKLIETEEVRA